MRAGLGVVVSAKLRYMNQPDQPRVGQGVPEGGQWTNYDNPDQIVGYVPPLAAAEGPAIEVPAWSDSDDTEAETPPAAEGLAIEVPAWSDSDDTEAETPPAAEAPAEAETPPAAEAPAEAKTPPAAEAPAEAETPPAAEAPAEAKTPPAAEAPAEAKTPPAAEALSEAKTPLVGGGSDPTATSKQPAKQDSSNGRSGGMLGRLLKRR